MKVDPALGLARRAARAGERGREGLGPRRSRVAARRCAAAPRAGHRRRTDRPARRAARHAARPRRARLRSQRDRPEAASSPRALGATYHCERIDALATLAPDIVIECTGAPPVIATLLAACRARQRDLPRRRRRLASRATSTSGLFNRNMVLNNGTVFGTVNANLRHYEMAAERARARRSRLARAPDHAPRAARALRRGVRAPQGRHQGRDRVRRLMAPPHRGLCADRRLRERRAGRRATARSTGCAGRASIPMPASRRCSASRSTAASASRRRARSTQHHAPLPPGHADPRDALRDRRRRRDADRLHADPRRAIRTACASSSASAAACRCASS